MRVHLRIEPGKSKTHCGLTSAHIVLRTIDPKQASCHRCFDSAKRKGFIKWQTSTNQWVVVEQGVTT